MALRSIKDATKESRDVRMRKQLYRQIFFVVDADFGGTLDIHEIAEFGQSRRAGGEKPKIPGNLENICT